MFFIFVLKYFLFLFSLTSSRDFIIRQLLHFDYLLLPAGFRGLWKFGGAFLVVWRGGGFLGNSGNSRFRGFPDFRDFAAARFFAFSRFRGLPGGAFSGGFRGKAQQVAVFQLYGRGLDAAALGCGGLRASVLYQRCSAGTCTGFGSAKTS